MHQSLKKKTISYKLVDNLLVTFTVHSVVNNRAKQPVHISGQLNRRQRIFKG